VSSVTALGEMMVEDASMPSASSRFWAAWFLSVIAVVASACHGTDGPPQTVGTSSSVAPTGRIVVTLEPTASGGCCRVVTMNPGEASTVICFVVGFDPTGHLIATVLVPPKPAGHRRSSGFVASPGASDHGVVEMPFDLERDIYRSTCRPAAWHGGAPI
jgi:hypothetical protein